MSFQQTTWESTTEMNQTGVSETIR